ncbi:hypothetical protein N752_07835 [Desulforamulus aquiferis]|nr:hypothetical protein [Desulforamulus aquiferis]RYD05794.1 hypothetical protein N752_07835 [Desulforamulus aquiferis]
MSDIANHPLLIEGKINNSFSHKDTIMARQTPGGPLKMAVLKIQHYIPGMAQVGCILMQPL